MNGNMKHRVRPASSLRRPSASHLETHLGYWLRCASNQVSHALSRELEDKGVTLAEWVVMRELYDADRRPAALSDRLGLTRGAISKLAERLVTKLMVTQQASPGDGRAQMLALTDTGRSVVPVLAQLADKIDAEFFGHLDPRTRVLIASVMREIVLRRRSRAAPVARRP
jgi:DNA-binding MarR family transcriptional regulator